MSTLTLVVTLFMCFTLSMCSGSKKENIDEEQLSQTTQEADTSDVPPMPAPPVPIAPGTAKVTATIVSTEEADRGYHCLMKIEQVHGYGSSTPPLPAGSEIKALIPTQVLENALNDMPMESFLAPEKSIELTLRHSDLVKMRDNSLPSWHVSSIKP